MECFKRGITTIDEPFYKSEIFIVAINTKDNYLATVANLISSIPPTSTILLMSSISVYREFSSSVDEHSVITKQSLQKDVEDLVLANIKNSVVLRLGGLMGEDRVAGRWSSAKSFEDGYVNYVHRDDVVNIIKKLIQDNIKSGVFNIVAPLHPTRKEVHKLNATRFGVKLGEFNGFSHRVVLSDKIQNELGYEFIYKNPLEFWSSYDYTLTDDIVE